MGRIEVLHSPAPTLTFLIIYYLLCSSEEVVSLVGGHLAGLKGKVSRSDLLKKAPTSVGTAAVEGKDHHRESLGESWIFQEENVGAHLIRNALGGGNDNMLRQMVSIPAPYSRRHRDDITVTVITWEEGVDRPAELATLPVLPRAKL
jgi:pyruvate dehydrogenase phosphatase